MRTVKIDLSINLQVSDELNERLSDPQQLEQYIIKNAFRNNSRVLLGASKDTEIKNNWIELYTELMDDNTTFDAFEVHGVKDLWKEMDVPTEQGTCFEQCDDSEASMWSVYIHIPDNGVECIADCSSRELAEKLAGMLEKAGKLFIRN